MRAGSADEAIANLREHGDDAKLLAGGMSLLPQFQRRVQDWAIVGSMAVRNGGARVALVNMGGTPLRATGVEESLAQGASPAKAAQRAAECTDPPADLNASPDYREHLARVLVRRALEIASA